MSPRKLTARIRALGARAGIARATLHCFRDTFPVDLLHKGVDIFLVAKLLGDTVAVVEKHYARFVTELRERARGLMTASAGLEGTIWDTIDSDGHPSIANKEFVAAGPVSRIRRSALQTDKLFEISRYEVSMMSTLAVLAGFASHRRHNGRSETIVCW
jgi:hypothetical protein